MQDIILSKYDNSSISNYRVAWKQAFKTAVNHLSHSANSREHDDIWNKEIAGNLSPTSQLESSNKSYNNACSSTSSLSYQKQLLKADYSNMSEIFLKLTKKWTLRTGKVVEDVIYNNTSKEFIVEHPAHSFILNTEDPVWKETFSQSELDEIESAANSFEFNKPFSSELQSVILRLNKKSNFRDIYDAIAGVEAHPVDDPKKS